MGTKRGVQVELALARLRALRPALRTWGLSATIGNLPEALETLLGERERRTRALVRGVETKQVVIDALIPPVVERFPWAGHLGTQMLPQVVAAIEEGASAIVFTNTRSQTEIWYQAILQARPDWAGAIALHHGSLDRKRAGLGGGRAAHRPSALRGRHLQPRPGRGLLAGGSRAPGRQPEGGRAAAAARGAERPPTRRGEPRDLRADQRARAGRGRRGARRRRGRRGRVAAPGGAAARRAGPARRHRGARRRLPARRAAGRGARRRAPTPELRDDEWAWVLDFVTRGGEALQRVPGVLPRGRETDGFYVDERSADRPAPPHVDRHHRRRRAHHRAVPPRRARSARWRSRSSRGSRRATASSSRGSRWSSCGCAT